METHSVYELFCKECKQYTIREHPTMYGYKKCNCCGYTKKDSIKVGLSQEGTIYRGSFAKYAEEEEDNG